MRIAVGDRFGPYEIVASLGAGGMGEVYRARDARLGREVAIKILSSAFAADPERLARFEREARALAALNHRNIATLYGVEDTAAGVALVMELVAGETLQARIVAHGSIPSDDALAIARQIADALDAAHERGIVHRDLKPANVAITSDGTVKVLDFGLAKTDGAGGSAVDDLSHSPTTVAPTLAGVLLGTAPYMAPEQARGKMVDKRADIWAFGCVLYEMLAGRRAFGGDTTTDTIAAIIEREPDWTALPTVTPASVLRLLERCLEKDPKRRLRDIGDARIDLDAPPSAEPAVAATGGNAGRRPAAAFAAGVLVTIAATALSLFGYRRLAPSDSTPAFPRVVRLTSGPAFETAPALSPDGKWVAYLSDARGQTDVWVKFLAGGEPVNLTAAVKLDVQSQSDIGGIAVSPDGASIAFDAGVPGDPASVTAWILPAPLGGSPRKFLPSARSVRWSPDGSHVVYVAAGGSAGDALVVADADGGNPREVARRLGGMHKHWPVWSSDGRFVYFNYSISTANAEPTEIYRVPASGGAIEPVVRTTRRAAFPLLLAQGRGLVYAANPDTFELGLWWRALHDSPPKRLTAGVGEYAQPTMSADGRRLVSVFVEFHQAIVALPTSGDAAAPQPVTDGSKGDLDPAFAPDGSRVVFSSTRSGNRNLWTAAADGSDARPLTSGSAIDERPVFSPDGRRIAFVSDRGGARGLWVVNADGGAARLVVKADAVDSISWASDNRHIAYALPGEQPELWIVSVDDGTTRRIATPRSAAEPAWSPRGDVIAYVDTVPAAGPGSLVTTRVAFTTSDARVVYAPISVPTIGNGAVAWDPAGERLAVYGNSGAAASAVWIVDPTGRQPFRRLAVFPIDVRLRGITWSRDGSTLLLGQQRRTSDLVLFEAE